MTVDSPPHRHVTRVYVTQSVGGVMAAHTPGVTGHSGLGVAETQLHVTPLPHQSAVSASDHVITPDSPHVPLLPAVKADAVTENDPHWPCHAVNLCV